MAAKKEEPAAVSPERLKALADGVFAIVMTLLVLQLGVPAARGSASEAELLRQLGGLWPEFLIYALSFMILGVFWFMHHSVFSVVRRFDSTLVWLNILFLMFVSLVPFSTALAARNGFGTVTAVVYGVNMLLIFNCGWASWAFITGKRRLVDGSIDAAMIRGGNRMGLFYAAVMWVSIGLAFLIPGVSFFIYSVVVLAFIVFTLMGKGEKALILPVAAQEKKGAGPGADGGK